MANVEIIIENKSYGDPDMIVNGRKMDVEEFMKNYGSNTDEINKHNDFILKSSKWGDGKKVKVIVNKSWSGNSISFE